MMQAIVLQSYPVIESENELAGFGSLFKGIGKYFAGNATQLLNLVPGGSSLVPLAQSGVNTVFGSNTSGIAKGLAAITTFCDSVITEMNKIANNANLNKADKLTNLRAIAALLDDKTKVYQARSGKDAEKLNRTRTDAATIIANVNNQVEAVANTNTTTATAAIAESSIISGFDNRYLFLSGALIGAYFLLKK